VQRQAGNVNGLASAFPELTMSKRKPGKRVQEYADTLQNWFYGSFYHDLIHSAVSLLSLASEERFSRSRLGENVVTRHGPGAIVLQVIGFDLWLSELIPVLTVGNDEGRELLSEQTERRYAKLYRRFHAGVDSRKLRALHVAVELRNEITHHFPRPPAAQEWLADIESLLVTHPLAPRYDLDLIQKLSSYALAYWAFQVTGELAGDLLAGSTIGAAVIHQNDVDHFRRYRTVPPPATANTRPRVRL